MLDLLLAVLRAASRSQQKSVQIPVLAQESCPARIPWEAGGWQGCRECPDSWGTGAGHGGVSEGCGAGQALPRQTGAGLFLPAYFLTFLLSCSSVTS